MAIVQPDPKLRVEKAFVALVGDCAELTTTTIVCGSDRQTNVDPPYIMCWAESVETRSLDFIIVKMQVVLVTNIDDTTNAARMAEAGRLFEHLHTGRLYETNDVRILGWSRPIPREASSGQETGDSLILYAGVQLATWTEP